VGGKRENVMTIFAGLPYCSGERGGTVVKLLAQELFFFLILTHPVYKM